MSTNYDQWCNKKSKLSVRLGNNGAMWLIKGKELKEDLSEGWHLNGDVKAQRSGYCKRQQEIVEALEKRGQRPCPGGWLSCLGNLAVVARALVGDSEIGDTFFSHDSVAWKLLPDTEGHWRILSRGRTCSNLYFSNVTWWLSRKVTVARQIF